ncbi:MAG: PmoA family protein [Cyclobacteriaceae bacterium]
MSLRSLSIILILSFFCLPKVVSQEIEIVENSQGILFMEDDDSILFYQTANKDLNGTYSRSNYIHPLYSLDGKVITEDFPDDHLHHRGIFWAWHQLYIGEKRIGDGWEIKDFEWRVKQVKQLLSPDNIKKIAIEVDWLSPLWVDQDGNRKPVINEVTELSVYPKNETYRRIDFNITINATEPATRIGGSEDAKGYGGFSARVKLSDGVEFAGPEGIITPENLPIKSTGWIDMVNLTDNSGESGLCIIEHPSNPGYPNPWILRSKGSMQNPVWPHPGAKPVPLSMETPVSLGYSLIIHDQLTPDEITQIYQNYIK